MDSTAIPAGRQPVSGPTTKRKKYDVDEFWREYVEALDDLVGNVFTAEEKALASANYANIWRKLHKKLGWTRYADLTDYLHAIPGGL